MRKAMILTAALTALSGCGQGEDDVAQILNADQARRVQPRQPQR